MKSVTMNIDSHEKTWFTPLWILNVLEPFDLDPCCPDGKMPWTTAHKMVRKSEDGLKTNWDGKRVYLNPPYGNEARPFFEKMAEHRGGGIALVYARTDTSIWQDLIFPNAAAILFMRKRIRFCRQDGTEGGQSTAPSAFVAYSGRDADILDALSDPDGWNILKGYFLPLPRRRKRHEPAESEVK